MNIKNIKWNDKGLIPAVIQDASSLNVLMLGYMNNESVQVTVAAKDMGTTFHQKRNLVRARV